MTASAIEVDDVEFAALLEFLNETPNKLEDFAAGFSNAELRVSSPDEFSLLENICHLRDLELQGYTPRIRRILAETTPALADFDGARVAAESNYNAAQPEIALQAFQTARRKNVEVLQVLTDEQLSREGRLEGVGGVSLRRLAELMREHDEGHLEDLRVLSQRLRQMREE
jgi:formate dehydrogenase assembly factor FdhD